MKTEEEIVERLYWCKKALNDEENKSETIQIKLWTEINLINWILK